MLKNIEGQRVPDVTFPVRINNEWDKVTSNDLFAGKTVILFSLPGAFTPTCSSTHLPRYNELASVFAKEGVDSIICVSVNDPFVMEAWSTDLNAKNIYMLPDGNCEFTEGMGMLVDKSSLGFGKRSWRYSMLIKDGVIDKMFIEPEKDGDPFEVSDADTMLNYINAEAEQPKPVSIITKPGCGHCARAKKMLQEAALAYEEIELGSNGISYSTLRAISGRGLAPQIFVDGAPIGGADELQAWLSAR